MTHDLWACTEFTPKAPVIYIFYGNDCFMTLESPVSLVEMPSDFFLSQLYLLEMFSFNAFASWLLLISHNSVNFKNPLCHLIAGY